MKQPIILGEKTTGILSLYDYFVPLASPDEVLTWNSNRQSAFALQDGESQAEVATRLLSLDQNNAYKMLEEYEFFPASTSLIGSNRFLCFQAPLNGKITFVRKWPDKFVIVFMPSNYSEWKFSTSGSEPDFKRIHGNAWVFAKYRTRTTGESRDLSDPFSELQMARFTKSLIAEWLVQEDSDRIYISIDGTRTEIVSRDDIDLIIAEANPRDRKEKAAEVAEDIYNWHSTVFPLFDSNTWFPVKAGSIAPFFEFSGAVVSDPLPSIKMGVVEIPRFENSEPLIERNWTYFDSHKILDSLTFDPVITFTTVRTPPYYNAWYPFSLLNADRIRKVGMGNVELFNPPQANVYNRRDLAIPHDVVSYNYIDSVIFCSETTNRWSHLFLDNELSTDALPYSPSPPSSNTQFSPTYRFEDKPYVTIKSENSTSIHNLLLQKFPLISDLLRSHIIRLCVREHHKWHPEPPPFPGRDHPYYEETDTVAGPWILDYWQELDRGLGHTPRQHVNVESVPWSAAFISWVMRSAAAAAGLTMPRLNTIFAFSGAHMHYIRQAKADRVAGNTDALYWLYDIEDAAAYPLEIGDLLVKNRLVGSLALDSWAREQINPNNAHLVGDERFFESLSDYNTYQQTHSGTQLQPFTRHTYTAYDSRHYFVGLGHSDLIIELRPDRVITCGGNVIENVEKRAVYLFPAGHTKAGYVDPTRRYKLGNHINDLPQNIGKNANSSQSKYFAIMKLRNIYIPIPE